MEWFEVMVKAISSTEFLQSLYYFKSIYVFKCSPFIQNVEKITKAANTLINRSEYPKQRQGPIISALLWLELVLRQDAVNTFFTSFLFYLITRLLMNCLP